MAFVVLARSIGLGEFVENARRVNGRRLEALDRNGHSC